MLVTVLSVSGAPGVTTLCLALGSTWPTGVSGGPAPRRLPPGASAAGSWSEEPAGSWSEEPAGSWSEEGSPSSDQPVPVLPALVAECDPHGGVVAARFGLEDRRGWGGLCATVRRQGSAGVDAFVDVLPGGVHVLVGCRPGERGALRGPVRTRACDELVAEAGRRDVIVDLGRFDPELEAGDGLLARSDRVVVLVRPDVGSLVRLCDHAGRLRSSGPDAIGVVLRGRSPYTSGAVARGTGLVVLGTVPDAPAGAGVVAGELPPRRHSFRSRYLRAVRSLAESLVGGPRRGGGTGPGRDHQLTHRSGGWRGGGGQSVSRAGGGRGA